MRRIVLVLVALAALAASAAPARAIGTVSLRAAGVKHHATSAHASRVHPRHGAVSRPGGSAQPSAPSGAGGSSAPAAAAPAAPAAPTSASAGGPAAVAADLGALGNALLAAVNGARADAGLPALTLDAGLEAAARAHTQNLLAAGAFTHDFVDGTASTPFAGWIGRYYRGACAGENLATGSPELTPAEAVAMWLASPGHRANLLSARFTTVGVALSAVGGTWIATADFGGC